MDYHSVDFTFKYCIVCERRFRLAADWKHQNKGDILDRRGKIRPNVQRSKVEQKGIKNSEETQGFGLSGHRVRSTLPVVQGEEGAQQL